MKGKQRSSSMSFLQLMSDQSAHARGEEPQDRSARQRPDEEESEWIVPLPVVPTPPSVTERINFFQELARRAQLREVSQRDVEDRIANYPDLDLDATMFYWSPAGVPSQQAIEQAMAQIAEVYPNATIKGTPLAFTVALIPLFEAQRNGFKTQIPDIAEDILEQFEGQDIASLAWLRKMADGYDRA